MSIVSFKSFNLSGTKDSFADWISDISPEDTFITSVSKKESTPSNIYKWQRDSLDEVVYEPIAGVNGWSESEGVDLISSTQRIGVKGTIEESGVTQVFYKAFTISDTALASSVHGRETELKYQLKKAGKELKNVMEIVFSSHQVKQAPSATDVAKSPSLFSMIAPIDTDNPDMPTPNTVGDFTVHKKGLISFGAINNICLGLYRNGSKANVILVNPVNFTELVKIANDTSTNSVFSAGGQDVTYSIETKEGVTRSEVVPTFRDSFGGVWEIKKSRFMPTDLIYFIDPDSIKQRVLREPKATQLGKYGASETWSLIVESGLVLTHPYSCGVLEIDATPTP